MSGSAVSIRELGPLDELLRALLSAKHLKNLADAFLLRKSENGLSVSFDCTVAECRAAFDTTYGVARLEMGHITGLGLQVVPDKPHHANIQGLPHKEQDPDQAEWLASKLAERAIVVDEGKVKQR